MFNVPQLVTPDCLNVELAEKVQLARMIFVDEPLLRLQQRSLENEIDVTP